jgi:hypothetical protein
MVKKIALWLGVGFLLVGLAGFAAPTLFGAHLSVAHNLVHLVTGAVSLWFGTRGTLAGARAFALAFGAVYVLLGVAGFVFGTTTGVSFQSTTSETNLLRVIPGVLELGTSDHVIHILLGGVYLVAALATHPVSTPGAPPRTRLT